MMGSFGCYRADMANDLAAAKKRIKELEAWAKKARSRIGELEALVHEVRDHVDPSKKDVVLAAKLAKKWVVRAVKILGRIF
jgi:hypothetical protein